MQPEMFGNKKIILASASPRRALLMKSLGVDFSVVVKEVNEDCPGLPDSPEEMAMCLAELKAAGFNPGELNPDEIIITADTVVSLNGSVIGKPVDRSDAVSMLRMLSGNMHIVFTGVCIMSAAKKVLFADETRVWFLLLSDEEINFYVDNFRPYDKAGGYGIQEWIGFAGVERIEGSYSNVVGLPTHRIYEELKRF